MAYFSKNELRNIAQTRNFSRQNFSAQLLLESQMFDSRKKSYDIFLSHSSLDAQEIAGLKYELERLFGMTVYVDWIDDPQLNRNYVTPNTAKIIKHRIQGCQIFIYAYSNNASHSKWMPWELGIGDGLAKTIYVLPVVDGYNTTIQTVEFVGIYPKLQKSDTNPNKLVTM